MGARAGAIVGTCEEMCPAPEREKRMRLSDVQVRRQLWWGQQAVRWRVLL
jgi:hypothetical protein